MVVIRITDLDLPVGVTHNATDWQVATDPLFTNIILESMDDEVNLTSKTFNDILDPDDKYYARARSLLSTGWTIWGNLDVFIVDDVYTTDDNLDMPGTITPPVITTDSIITEHLPTLFNISVSGFNTTGTGSHQATSYFITTLDGEVLWSDVFDEINKDKILIDELLLKEGNVYYLKAMFHSSSFDVSQLSSKLIHIPDSKIEIEGMIYDLDTTVDIELRISNKCDIASSSWKIYDVKEDGLHSLVMFNNIVGKPGTIVIPAGTLREYEKYYLEVSITDTEGNVLPKTYKEIATKFTQYAEQ